MGYHSETVLLFSKIKYVIAGLSHDVLALTLDEQFPTFGLGFGAFLCDIEGEFRVDSSSENFQYNFHVDCVNFSMILIVYTRSTA